LTISGGTVLCGIANALASAGAVNITSGTLNLSNLSQAIGSLSGTGGTITLGTGTLTSNASTTTSYAGTITGSGGFTLAGSGGTFNFTTTPGYTGTTTVNGSTLLLTTGAPLPSAGNLTVNSPGIFNLANFNQTVAVLAGNGSILLGSGTFTVNTPSASTSTFSGVISQTGNLDVGNGTTTGTLALTGVNTYTGNTVIESNATLQLGINNAIASTNSVTVDAMGTLDISPVASTQQTIGSLSGSGTVKMGAAKLTIKMTGNSTFSGTLGEVGDTGSLVVTGPQSDTFTLASTSNYTGGTTVNGGTVIAGAVDTLPSTGTLTINSPGIVQFAFNQSIGPLSGNGTLMIGQGINGQFTLPAGTTTTFSGVINSVGGDLVFAGSGTEILTGANTYTGFLPEITIDTNATLQGNATSLGGGISDQGTLIFNQTTPGTFSGSLSGTGTLIIEGGSSLTFANSASIGTTLVNAGELILGSGTTFTSPTVTVASRGSLGLMGSATIVGAVTNNGTLKLGLGTLNITGSYTQTAGSTFVLDVTSSTSGTLPVTGPVTLTGSPAIDIFIDPGIYAPSTVYTFITSTTPVTGTFAAPVFENPFFEGSLIYNAVLPGSVQLLLEIAPFSNVIKGGNAGAIAKCINLIAFPSESAILPIIETLIFLPVREVRSILDEIQPSQLKALSLTEENNLVVIRSTISQHLTDLYKTDCCQAISELYKWNVWGNISGDFLRQEGQSENIGYSADTAAVTVGIDAALAQNLFFGIAGAYDYSWLEWIHSKGHANIGSYYAGPYFSWYNHRIFTNLSLLGTYNTYEAQRHISFPTVNVHAKSSHNGYGLIGHFDFGVMMYPASEMSCSPIVGLDYIYLKEQGYTESGAGGLDMKIHPTNSSLLRTELGLQIAKCAILVHNKWTHDLKLSWIHQFPLTSKHLNARFKEFDCTYTVKGLQPNQDYFDVATGLTGIFMKDRLSAAIRYEGKFGDGIRDNTAYVQLAYRF
jgi:autotransporter-associated beta strand protein